MSLRECRKRVVVLAQQVLNETTEDHTPTAHWTDDDWYMFQYASATPEQGQVLRSLQRADGELDAQKVRELGYESLLRPGRNPFSMEDAARRIIGDSQARTGVFQPLWLTLLRSLTGASPKH